MQPSRAPVKGAAGHAAGKFSKQDFKHIEVDCIREIVTLQERVCFRLKAWLHREAPLWPLALM